VRVCGCVGVWVCLCVCVCLLTFTKVRELVILVRHHCDVVLVSYHVFTMCVCVYAIVHQTYSVHTYLPAVYARVRVCMCVYAYVWVSAWMSDISVISL